MFNVTQKKNQKKDKMVIRTVKNCFLRKADKTTDFLFCSHVLFFDDFNFMGIEFSDYQIRIDGIVISDQESYIHMMDSLKSLAEEMGVSRIFFADYLSDKLLEYFKSYGFEEIPVWGDNYNKYLEYREE